MSSTWMSLGLRCRFGLKVVPAGRVNSPDLRKPKNPKQHAAHIRSCSYWFLLRISACPIAFKILGVMGSLGSFARGCCLLLPFSANSSLPCHWVLKASLEVCVPNS